MGCPKHTIQICFAELMAQYRVLVTLAATVPKHFVVIQDWMRDSTTEAWQGYMQSACNCWDGASTTRLGASWASGGDIADLADFPEDFGPHYYPSSSS